MPDDLNFDELLGQCKDLVVHTGEPVLIKQLPGLKAVSEALVRECVRACGVSCVRVCVFV